MYVIYKNDFYLLVTSGIERNFEDVKRTNPEMEIVIKGGCRLKTVKIKDCEDYSVVRNS
jgi:hypothetical protein